jgi:PAS domain S-box-containing protein
MHSDSVLFARHQQAFVQLGDGSKECPSDVSIPEESLAEFHQLRAWVDHLGIVANLPELWIGREATYVVERLVEVLPRILRLNFAYARLRPFANEREFDVARSGIASGPAIDLDSLRRSLASWTVPGSCPALQSVPNPAGEGNVRAAALPLGINDELGVVVVGSERDDFPTRTEMLLLQLATGQATAGLNEALRIVEERSAERELEQRVAERTTQLNSVIVELGRVISGRVRTDDEHLMVAALIENCNDFIGLSSLDGRVLFVNPAGRALVGLKTEDEARSKRAIDFVAEGERSRDILQLVMRESHWDGETLFRHFQTGEIVPTLQHVFLIRASETDRPIAVGTIARDISQRKRAEKELIGLKDELAAELSAMTRLHEFGSLLLETDDVQTVFDAALDATMSLQGADFGTALLYNAREGAFTVVSHRGFSSSFVERRSGAVDGRTASGRAILERARVVIEDVELDERIGALREAALEAGFRAAQATPLFSRNREPVATITTYFRKPHRPSDRALQLTDLFARQAAAMIERHQTEQALQRSKFYLAEAQKISQTGSWSLNLANFDVFSSRENLRLFGVDPAGPAPTYLDYFALMHPDDRDLVRQKLEQACADGSDYEVLYRIIWPDHSTRYIHGIGRPMFDAAGQLIEYIGTNIDCTERKRAEEDLRQAQSELAHLNRAMTMGELTASIAHEISQPLTAVVANAQACVRWLSAIPANIREATMSAESIARDAMRATDVVSRIRALLVRSDPVKTNLRLDDVLLEVVSLVQSQARTHGVAMRLSLASDLPLVWGDRVQVQQVVLNLVINAIEAMRAFTGRPRELEIAAQRFDAALVHVFVRDSGPGLDAMHRDRIFDSFYTTKAQGMGMGLAISRSIMQAHGGQLWATGNDEGGETFHCTFPIAEAPEP